MSLEAARKLQGLLVNTSLSLVVTAGFLAVAEGLARRFEKPVPAHALADTHGLDWTAEWQDDFYVMKSASVGWPPWEDFNHDGLRDRRHPLEKPARTYRLVCLGDSVTLGYGFPRAQAWPQTLQGLVDARGPGVEVFNVALLGWSTRQERYAYERIARRYHPDGVLLAIVLNDLEDLANNLSRPPPLMAALFRRFALVRWLVNGEQREIESIEEVFERPEPARVTRAYALMFDEIRRLRDEVRADGAQLTLMVLPEADQVGAPGHLPIPEDRIAAFARAEGLALIDPLAALSVIGPTAYMDHLHLAPAGSARVAEAVLASATIPPPAYTTEPLRLALAHAGAPADPERAPVPTLATLLADASPDVRHEAAWGLGRQGATAITALSALVGALHDVDPAVRAAAARTLAALGPDAASGRPELFALLEDGHQEVRWAAAEALAAVGVDASQDVAPVVRALASRDSYIRGFAVWTLNQGGPAAKAAAPALEARLHDAEPGVRTLAIRALGNLRPSDAAAVAGLAEAVVRGTGDGRWRAARALAKLGPAASAASDALAHALSDPDEKVRTESALALAEIGRGASSAVPALVAAERDPSLMVREAAKEAVRRITASN